MYNFHCKNDIFKIFKIHVDPNLHHDFTYKLLSHFLIEKHLNYLRGCRHDHMVVGDLQLHLPMQSVPITTKVVSLNPAHGEVYSIQHYVIKFSMTCDRL